MEGRIVVMEGAPFRSIQGLSAVRDVAYRKQ